MQRLRQAGLRTLLAALLAVLLAIFGLLAAGNHAHQVFHRHDVHDEPGCVICLLAHGLADAAEVAVLPATVAYCQLFIPLLASAPVLPPLQHLLPPGRAPPPFSSVR